MVTGRRLGSCIVMFIFYSPDAPAKLGVWKDQDEGCKYEEWEGGQVNLGPMETNDQLIRAVQVATKKLASSGKFDVLLKDVLSICVEAVGASGGTIYLHDGQK